MLKLIIEYVLYILYLYFNIFANSKKIRTWIRTLIPIISIYSIFDQVLIFCRCIFFHISYFFDNLQQIPLENMKQVGRVMREGSFSEIEKVSFFSKVQTCHVIFFASWQFFSCRWKSLSSFRKKDFFRREHVSISEGNYFVLNQFLANSASSPNRPLPPPPPPCFMSKQQCS